MEKLLKLLNSMDVKAQTAFAKRCGTTIAYLRRVIYAAPGRKFSASLAIEIDRETDGDIKAESLAPDTDWRYIRGRRERARTPRGTRGCASA